MGACETAYFAVEPCLDKGDMLFIINSHYMAGRYGPGDRSAVAKSPVGTLLTSLKSADPPTANFESGNLYTIKKIYKEDPTTLTWDREDRFRIILDKNIPFEASEKVQFQETNATSGWLSKRGIGLLGAAFPALLVAAEDVISARRVRAIPIAVFVLLLFPPSLLAGPRRLAQPADPH